jgi:hypothetical protein
MTYINYESDFKLIESFSNDVPISTTPFVFEYYTKSLRNKVVVSYDGTTYSKCSPTNDGRLIVVFEDHSLDPGMLKVRRTFTLTDEHFEDDECTLIVEDVLPVILERGITDHQTSCCNISVCLPPYYQKGDEGKRGLEGKSAYQIWLEQGNQGNENDFINSLKLTEEEITAYGFTKNKGDYSKPDGGIPKEDLNPSINRTLVKADSAVQYIKVNDGLLLKELNGTVDLGKLVSNVKTINGEPVEGYGNLSLLPASKEEELKAEINKQGEDLQKEIAQKENELKTEIKQVYNRIQVLSQEEFDSLESPEEDCIYAIYK